MKNIEISKAKFADNLTSEIVILFLFLLEFFFVFNFFRLSQPIMENF